MTPFDLQIRTRFVHGTNVIEQLGTLAAELGAKRVLLVTDPGILAAGHANHGLHSLCAAGLTTELFDGVGENPTTEHVAAGLMVAERFKPELIVGFGGGSSMDCAKGINFLYTNGGQMRDYWGRNKATKPLLAMIAVPTTAGTGSEAQSYALISDAETHVKMACGDKKASFRVAILDPALTVTQPKRVTALTGIDALSHALESYVTKTRNAAAQLFAREAFVLLVRNLPRVMDDQYDLEARGAMQVGACMAGLAIENSMLGACHALANPLTARFGIVHGQAIALTLPAVIRYNAYAVSAEYAQLLRALPHVDPEGTDPPRIGAQLAAIVSQEIAAAGLLTKLRDVEIPREALPELAAEAAKQWTAEHNPRPVKQEDLLALYEASW